MSSRLWSAVAWENLLGEIIIPKVENICTLVRKKDFGIDWGQIPPPSFLRACVHDVLFVLQLPRSNLLNPVELNAGIAKKILNAKTKVNSRNVPKKRGSKVIIIHYIRETFPYLLQVSVERKINVCFKQFKCALCTFTLIRCDIILVVIHYSKEDMVSLKN